MDFSNGRLITPNEIEDELGIPVMTMKDHDAIKEMYQSLCSNNGQSGEWISSLTFPPELMVDIRTLKKNIINNVIDINNYFYKKTNVSIKLLFKLMNALRTIDTDNNNDDFLPYYGIYGDYDLKASVSKALTNINRTKNVYPEIVKYRSQQAEKMLMNAIQELNINTKLKKALLNGTTIKDASLGNITEMMILWLCQEKGYHPGDLNEIYAASTWAANNDMKVIPVEELLSLHNGLYKVIFQTLEITPQAAWINDDGAMVIQLGGPDQTDCVLINNHEPFNPHYLEFKHAVSANLHHNVVQYDEDGLFRQGYV